MHESGVTPSGATYNMLIQMAENAYIEHAPEVYEAFKLGGVPERICYTIASATAFSGVQQISAELRDERKRAIRMLASEAGKSNMKRKPKLPLRNREKRLV